MADLFQPQVQDTSQAGTTFVQQGVRDNSTATAIETFGKMGTNVFKGSVLADLEGSSDNKDFVDPSDAEFADEKAVLDQLNLTTITAARKQNNLSGSRAAALVNSKAKSLINQHPYFAQEIKKSVGEFFQGSGAKGKFFTDELSLVDQGIVAGVKSGNIDPTAPREEQIRQLQARSQTNISKNRLGLTKLETEVGEEAVNIQVTKDSRDYFNSQGITIEHDIQQVLALKGELTDAELVERLERLKQDTDAEGRRNIDVSRIGEPAYQAQFDSLIASKIGLEQDLLTGTISKEIYNTKLTNLKNMGALSILEQPGVPEALAVFDMVRNLPVGLITGPTQVKIASLMSEVASLAGDIETARKSGVTPLVLKGSLPAVTTGEAKPLYKMFTDTLSEYGTASPERKALIAQEVGVMLSGHADGVGRYADKFDQERWDQLTTFFADPRTAGFIGDNLQSFPESARKGLENIIQFTYTDQLLGAAQAQMQDTISSQLSIGAPTFQGRMSAEGSKPFSDFVTIAVDGGEMQFVIKPGAGDGIPGFSQAALGRRVQKLNTNYGSRVNKVVKVSSHLQGHTKYGPVLKTALEQTGLLQEGPETSPQAATGGTKVDLADGTYKDKNGVIVVVKGGVATAQ